MAAERRPRDILIGSIEGPLPLRRTLTEDWQRVDCGSPLESPDHEVFARMMARVAGGLAGAMRAEGSQAGQLGGAVHGRDLIGKDHLLTAQASIGARLKARGRDPKTSRVNSSLLPFPSSTRGPL